MGKPGKKSLILSSSCMRWSKGLSAWIVSSFWSHSSPNFWTSQSRFLLSNWFFFSSLTICLLLKPMILTEPVKATAWLLDQGQNCIPAKCGTSSTKILLDSCRVFPEYAKIKQAKERLCWWSELGGKQQKITTSTYKQFTSCRRSWAEIAFKTFFLLVSWISPPSISSSSIKYAFSKLKMMSSSHTF